jgi:hypothetical protein
VAHPCHEFPRIRARIGGELVAGMAQVVNVNAFQADRGERREPDPPPELVLDSAMPSALVKARSSGGTEQRCLRRSGTIRSAKSTTRRPARDFGGPNNGTAPGLLSWRVTRTVQPSRAAPAAPLAPATGLCAGDARPARARHAGQQPQINPAHMQTAGAAPGHLPRLPLSRSWAPRLGRPAGVASGWLR